jgi:RNA polymerase sigma-32 factor
VTTLTLVSSEGGLRRYLSEIRKYPLLDKDEEYMLARRWNEDQDVSAAHRLVTSHLRLCAKIAFGYRGYGLPLSEMISEGNLGLMHAVKKFDPDRGVRLATYAMWWIKSSIQEYILRSWSLVKLGTTAAQKKLFFNLRRAKAKISAFSDGGLSNDQAEAIAKSLDVRTEEVLEMDQRLSGRDSSLNIPCSPGSELQWQDLLQDGATATPEEQVAEFEERSLGATLLKDALATLTARERHVLTERRLRDSPLLLDDLAYEYGVSRERIRQIEVRAFEKVKNYVTARASDYGERDFKYVGAEASAGRTALPL